METFYNKIQQLRPLLSASSTKTYSNILKNVFYDLNSKETPLDFMFFINNQDRILEHLKNTKPSIRKTYLSALVVISQENLEVQKHYRTMMMSDSAEHAAFQKTHKMSDKERENWITWNEVEGTLDKLKKMYNYVLKEKNPTKDELYNLQKIVILSCYVLIPPRRSLDYTCMKSSNFDPEKDNYYLKGNFFFNNYKTSKYLGLQFQKVGKTLETILKKWINIHNSEFLFTDLEGKPFNSGTWTKVLNSIFKKNISVNQLRHIYITEKCNPMIEKLKETASAMGHSTNIQEQYVKIVDEEEVN